MSSTSTPIDPTATTGLSRLAALSARWSATHPWLAILGWLGAVVGAVCLAVLIPTVSTQDEDYYLGESGQASTWVDEAGIEVPASESVLITPLGGGALSESLAEEVGDDLSDQWSGLEEVAEVIPLQVSADGQAALTGVSLSAETRDAEAVSLATEQVAAQYPQVIVRQAGSLTIDEAIDQQIASDLRSAEVFSIPITLALMLLAFGTLISAGIPVLLAVCSVAATIGVVAPLSHVIPAEPTVYSMIVLIGMAVGVDYALFYSKRVARERAAGHQSIDAVEIAARTSGHAILVSGAAVIVCMGGLFIVGQATFTSLATGSIVVVAIAVLGSVTVLPALLGGLGHWVDRPRIPILWRLGARVSRAGVSTRLLGPVIDHPRSALAASTLLLALLTVPALGLRLHTSTLEALPDSITEVATAQAIRDHFATSGPTAVVVAKAQGPAAASAVSPAFTDLEREVEEDKDLTVSGEIERSPDQLISLMTIIIDDRLSDDGADRAIERLREELVPAAFTGGSIDVAVGGEAADSLDYVERQAQRLPWVVGGVLGVTFLMMLAAFRSLPIAVVSTALNLLSVGAAFGVLVMVFDYGWGASWLGIDAPGYIIDWIPLFVLVVLIGLSMDYHVFVLSRVREWVRAGLPTRVAVRRGVSDTAGVVTSAAAVMISVFSVFAMLSLMEMKMLGVGLAAAILLDATLVRLVMLPAALTLLGDRAWWPGTVGRPRGMRIDSTRKVQDLAHNRDDLPLSL
ncbi:MAG: MMPL family transporter [Ornithinimicrobium sp.]